MSTKLIKWEKSSAVEQQEKKTTEDVKVRVSMQGQKKTKNKPALLRSKTFIEGTREVKATITFSHSLFECMTRRFSGRSHALKKQRNKRTKKNDASTPSALFFYSNCKQ